MKKNVLFVVDEQMYGGISTVLVNILRRLDYSDYDVDVLILHNRGNGISKENIPKNVNIISGTEFFGAIDYTISAAIASKNISIILHKVQIVLGLKIGWIKNRIAKERKKILKKHYDVEIAFKDGFCALFTACGDSDKKISWLHTSYDVCDNTEKYRSLFINVYEKIDRVVAITEDVSKTFNDIYHLENKTELIENLMDIDMIFEKSKDEIVDFPKDKINLICVGRVAPAKAYPRFLEQIVKIKREGLFENVLVHIIGDGDEFLVVEKLIKDNDLGDCVKMYGYKENPYPYIAQSDMLVLPSFYEGQGIVLIEANLLGVPCFATRFANADKTLNYGKYGLVVDNTEDGIYNGLKNLLLSWGEENDKYKKNLKEYKYDKNDEIMRNIYNLLNLK